MADNRFSNNDEFEDIFSNGPKKDEFEDIYSSAPADDEFEEISSFSHEPYEDFAPRANYRKSTPGNDDGFSNDDFAVKYNSAVQNRRRQEVNFGDVSEMYGDLSSGSKPPRQKRRRKGHPVRNTVLVLLAVLIAGGACVGFYGYSTVKKLLDSFDAAEPLAENKYISDSELYSDDEQINILLVGVDAREGEKASRSDTMMLVTLDNKNGEIKLTSFLRDSYVQIAGRRKEKLNAAYFRGGIQGLADTLELNFKVNIPYYMVVDFNIFTAVVDELGGIEIEVTEKESAYTYRTETSNKILGIPAGESVHINGEQALWYSRIRYLDSDFMRTQRQRKVISAIVEKARSLKPTELISLAKKILPMVSTNMTSKEMMSYGVSAILDKAYSYPIAQQQIPAEGTWSSKKISGVGACLVMDVEENAEILEKFLKNKQVSTPEADTKAEK